MASPPWGNTSWLDLDFARDCSLFAAYVGPLVAGTNEPPFPVVASFFRAVLPDSNSTNSDILGWNDWVWENRKALVAVSEDIPTCREQLCRTLTADLGESIAGVGMLTSHCLQALLVTLYFASAVFTFVKNRQTRSDAPRTPSFLINRFTNAFYGTTNEFFMTSFVLTLSLQLTVIIRRYSTDQLTTSIAYTRGRTEIQTGRNHPYSYTTPIDLLVSCFAFFPLAVLLPVMLFKARRQWLRAAFLTVLWLGSWTSFVVSIMEDGRSSGVIGAEKDLCPRDYTGGPFFAASVFPTHGIVMWVPGLFGLSMLVLLAWYKCAGRQMWRTHKVLRRIIRVAAILYSVVAFLCMWLMLILLIVYLTGTSWFAHTPWNLGQIVAIVIWVPVLFELVYMLSVGIDHGLEQRLPKEFVVDRIDDDGRSGSGSGDAADEVDEVDEIVEVRRSTSVGESNPAPAAIAWDPAPRPIYA